MKNYTKNMIVKKILLVILLFAWINVEAQTSEEAIKFKKTVTDKVVAFNGIIDSLSTTLKKARASKSADTLIIKEQRKSMVVKCFLVPQVFIKANPSSIFCLQALGMLGEGRAGSPVELSDLNRFYNSVSDRVKNSQYGKQYSSQLNSWDWMHKLVKAVDDHSALESITQEDARQQLGQRMGKKAAVSRSVHRSLLSRDDKGQQTSLMEEREMVSKVKAATLVVNMAYKKQEGAKAVIGSNAATAYVIDPTGICVTNYHVVKEYSGTGPYFSLSVMTASGKSYPVVAVLAASEVDDLAIVKVDIGGELLSALPLGNTAAVDSDVFVLGHPISGNGQGGVLQEFYKLTNGKVTANRTAVLIGQPCQVMEITAEFTKGSSGGPIVDRYGNLVGTVSRLNGEKKIGVPVSELRKLLVLNK
jgi:S1-C subfamily serine protease